MKKLLLLPVVAFALFSSCKPIDPVQDFDEYTNCVVYAHNSSTGEGVATDFARISVSANMASGLFTLDFADFKLSPEGNVVGARIDGLQQYLKDVRDEQGNTTDVLYTFFNKEGNTYCEGDMPVSDLRFGWLSTVYWCSFTSDRTKVWSLPREVQTYANKTVVLTILGDTVATKPTPARFDVEINASAKTASFRGSAVVYPAQSDGQEKVFSFRSLAWNNLPIVFDERGFSVARMDFMPETDGRAGDFKIENFTCRFDADYDNQRYAEFDITHVADGKKVHVTTYFDYFRNQN